MCDIIFYLTKGDDTFTMYINSLKVTLVWKKLAAEAKQKLAAEAKLKLAAEAKLRKEAKDRESDDSTLLYYKQ